MITYILYIPGSISNATVNGRRAPLLAGSKTSTQTLTLPELSVDSYVVGLKPTDISENRVSYKESCNNKPMHVWLYVTWGTKVNSCMDTVCMVAEKCHSNFHLPTSNFHLHYPTSI